MMFSLMQVVRLCLKATAMSGWCANYSRLAAHRCNRGVSGNLLLCLFFLLANSRVVLADPPFSAVHYGDRTSHTIDGVGTAARFGAISGMAFDRKGNLFVVDPVDAVVRKITRSAQVSTFAGAPGQPGYSDGVGSAARFAPGIRGIAIDSNDSLYVTDASNAVIRRITPLGEVSTFVGQPLKGGIVDGIGTQARLAGPEGIAIDSAGNFYVAELGGIRKITPRGEVSTLAGVTEIGMNTDFNGYRDGQGSVSRFSSPQGIVIGPQGNLFVVDSGNLLIRKVTPLGVVTTFAGAVDPPDASRGFPNGTGRRGASDGPGTVATFNHLVGGIVIDRSANLYVGDALGPLVRKISRSAVVTTLLATPESPSVGHGAKAVTGTNGAGGLAIGQAGDLYVSVGFAHTSSSGGAFHSQDFFEWRNHDFCRTGSTSG